ncbi:MAG: hypothetical protein IVW36_10990 [Dehalococcoidia bacterium]|nr:hypothetical protein [Dehalococcoidia bacterium]
MADPQATGLEQELTQAFDDLRRALEQAAEATRALGGLAPRLRAVGEVFDKIDAAIAEGRQQIGATGVGARPSPAAVTRPTLVVPAVAHAAPSPQPAPAAAIDLASVPEATHELREIVATDADLASFRLEFESRPGPLDLRAVDEAISEHPAVRDIALLDYDGHRATLKVWVEGSTSPASVQVAIRDRVRALFPSENEVTVVALEDAA